MQGQYTMYPFGSLSKQLTTARYASSCKYRANCCIIFMKASLKQGCSQSKYSCCMCMPHYFKQFYRIFKISKLQETNIYSKISKNMFASVCVWFLFSVLRKLSVMGKYTGLPLTHCILLTLEGVTGTRFNLRKLKHPVEKYATEE